MVCHDYDGKAEETILSVMLFQATVSLLSAHSNSSEIIVALIPSCIEYLMLYFPSTKQ